MDKNVISQGELERERQYREAANQTVEPAVVEERTRVPDAELVESIGPLAPELVAAGIGRASRLSEPTLGVLVAHLVGDEAADEASAGRIHGALHWARLALQEFEGGVDDAKKAQPAYENIMRCVRDLLGAGIMSARPIGTVLEKVPSEAHAVAREGITTVLREVLRVMLRSNPQAGAILGVLEAQHAEQSRDSRRNLAPRPEAA
jgi:hypothetical protein